MLIVGQGKNVKILLLLIGELPSKNDKGTLRFGIGRALALNYPILARGSNACGKFLPSQTITSTAIVHFCLAMVSLSYVASGIIENILCQLA
jgi:hypothetical protein